MELNFRPTGAIGALLAIYEEALVSLLETIDGISTSQLIEVIDHHTKDPDCKSVQSILTHLVQSGYTYAIEIKRWLGKPVKYKNKVELESIEEYKEALKMMFKFTKQLFQDHPKIELCECDPSKKIKVRWGQQYDIEQLLEHAVLHILRHKRQIEQLSFMHGQS